MDLNLLDIVIHMINIVVLYVLLRLILYKPIKSFMQTRTERIEGMQQEAANEKEKAEELLAAQADILEEAKIEAEKEMQIRTAEANEKAAAILETANRQADELLLSARSKSAEERKEMLASVEKQISGMAIELASDILAREVKEADNEKIIDAFFRKVG